ncbi:MAG: hypothetical protein KAH17_07405 [Bacteroidales bacterium]|nr:hypothetical protein [Bacteroidales bacterium]
MKLKIISIIFFVANLTVFPVSGQEVLIDEAPETSTDQGSWGPNRNNYIQLTFYRGQYLPIGGVMLETKTIQNLSTGVQLQYKRKINNTFSGIVEAVYNSDQFGLNCDKPSQINGATSYYKEQLIMHSAGINTLFRVNIDKKRGNHLGQYLEVGLFVDYLFISNHIGFSDGSASSGKFKKVKVTESGLNYINPLQYGYMIRIGMDKYGLFYKNRFTYWINDPTINGFLPSHQLGIVYSFTD